MSYQEALMELELKEHFTEEQLSKQYRVLAIKYHPDPHLGEGEEIFQKFNEKMQRINEAYTLLKKRLKGTNADLQALKKEVENFKAIWRRDIDNLRRTYDKNKKIQSICDRYAKRLELLHTLEELKIQKENFNQEIGKEKKQIALLEEKRPFKRKLENAFAFYDSHEMKKLGESLLYTSFIQSYLEKLDACSSLQEIKELEEMYEKELALLKQERDKKYLNNEKENFLTMLKEKELTETYKPLLDLIKLTKEEVEKCSSYDDLRNIKMNFLEKEVKMKGEKQEFLHEKTSFFHDLKKVQTQFPVQMQDLVVKYNGLLASVTSIEEVLKIEDEFQGEFQKFLEQKQKEKEKEDLFKDKLKRVMIYKFYSFSKTASLGQIKKAREVLEKGLLVLKEISEKPEEMAKKLENLHFSSPEEEMSRLDFYLSVLHGKIQVKSKEELEQFLHLFPDVKPKMEEEEILSLEKEQVKETLLQSFYHHLTNVSLENVDSSFFLFDKVFSFVFTMDERRFLENLRTIQKINFNEKEQVEEILGNLKESNDVYICFKTGEICTLQDLNGNVLVTPLDSSKGVSVISSYDAKREYISLHEFFKKATCCLRKIVCVKGRYGGVKQPLRDFQQVDMYFYKQLLLTGRKNSSFFDDESIEKFEFLTARYGWAIPRVNADEYLKEEIYDTFKDREACEGMVMEQIKGKMKEEISEKRI